MTWLQSSLRSALGQKLSSLVDRKLFSFMPFLAGSSVFDELLAEDLFVWHGYGAKVVLFGTIMLVLGIPVYVWQR